MQCPSRRRFLLLSAALGSAVGAGWLASRVFRSGIRQNSDAAANSATASDADLQRVTRTSRALGSQVSITALHASSRVARRAIDVAFAELETVEEVMSIYRPDSQLSRLNNTGTLAGPHPYLVEVLRQAEVTSRESNGAFDITVQPLWRLYSAAHQAGRLPDSAAVAAARNQVDWRQVRVTPHHVSLSGTGTAITLNGIAQGFAADRAMAALREHGIEQAMVDTGEIAPLGTKEQSEPWVAGVQHPRELEAYVAVAQLAGRCLATSGDYATTFSADYKYNHLFDPRNGRSPEETASVSIVAPTAMQADALSTAVFVLGSDRGLALVERMDGVDALFVLKDGRMLTTKGFPIREEA